MFNNIARRPDNDSRNAVFFKMTCNQTHGLVAVGSDRCQESDIDRFLAQPIQQQRRVNLAGFALAVGVIDAVRAWRERANPPFLAQFAQPGNREEGIDILQCRRMTVKAVRLTVEVLDQRIGRE